jgi:hypothetical protein
MPINVSSITGCCNGMNFYNLGGAHGHRTASNQDEFDQWLICRQRYGINIAVTNSAQARTREYLAGAGWEHKKVGQLWISTISGADFDMHRAKVQIRQQELKKQKEEEHKKRYEEMKAAMKFSDVKVYLDKIRLEDVSMICGGNRVITENKVAVAKNLSDFYMVDIPVSIFNYPWGNHRSIHDIRRVIYDLVSKKRRALGF